MSTATMWTANELDREASIFIQSLKGNRMELDDGDDTKKESFLSRMVPDSILGCLFYPVLTIIILFAALVLFVIFNVVNIWVLLSKIVKLIFKPFKCFWDCIR